MNKLYIEEYVISDVDAGHQRNDAENDGMLKPRSFDNHIFREYSHSRRYRRIALASFAVIFLLIGVVFTVKSMNSNNVSERQGNLVKDSPIVNDEPAEQPTASADVKCFEKRDELRTSIVQYLSGNESSVEIKSTYGNVMNDWCVSNIEDFSYLFSMLPVDMALDEASSFVLPYPNYFYNDYASSFNEDISNWDVSNAKDMSNMFSFASIFNQDTSSWNLSSVTNMNSMFYSAIQFNQDISNWDVGIVKDMSSMFGSAMEFNQDLSKWNVGNVVYMQSTFNDAQSFNSDISTWDTSSVQDMSYMFANTVLFNGNISMWNTSSVLTMDNMFYNSYEFNNDISEWDVSSVVDMAAMFNNATAFNQDVSRWELRSVTSVQSMFATASSFNQNLCPWGSHITIQDVDRFQFMFFETDCSTTIDPASTSNGPYCSVCN